MYNYILYIFKLNYRIIILLFKKSELHQNYFFYEIFSVTYNIIVICSIQLLVLKKNV